MESALPGDADRANPLFGEIKDDGIGRMSPLIVYGATFEHAGPKTERPLADKKSYGQAISARTAIDRRRGAADRHKLFHAAEVARGATFRFEALFLPSYADNAGAAGGQLKTLLFLLQEHGVAAGRAPTRTGHGRLTIDGEFNAIRVVMNGAGDLVTSRAPGFDRASLRADAQRRSRTQRRASANATL